MTLVCNSAGRFLRNQPCALMSFMLYRFKGSTTNIFAIKSLRLLHEKGQSRVYCAGRLTHSG